MKRQRWNLHDLLELGKAINAVFSDPGAMGRCRHWGQRVAQQDPLWTGFDWTRAALIAGQLGATIEQLEAFPDEHWAMLSNQGCDPVDAMHEVMVVVNTLGLELVPPASVETSIHPAGKAWLAETQPNWTEYSCEIDLTVFDGEVVEARLILHPYDAQVEPGQGERTKVWAPFTIDWRNR